MGISFDLEGNEILSGKGVVSILSCGAAKFYENGKYGLVDLDGNVLVPARYFNIGGFGNGLVEFQENGKYGLMDISGNVIASAKYSYIWMEENGLVRFNEDGKYGLMDMSGNIILPADYDSLSYLFDNYVSFRIMDGSDSYTNGIADLDGNVLFTVGEDYEKSCGDGLFRFGSTVYNTKGETVIDGLDNVLISGKYVFAAKDYKIGCFINPYYVENPTAADMSDADDWAEESIDWALSNGYADAFGSRWFGAELSCPRWEVVSILWKAMGSPAPTGAENPFIDVSPDADYYDAILWAYENGIANGVGGGRFNVYGSVTRGDAMTFIHRALGTPASGGANPFDDVPAGEYYTDAVLWAAENGIAKGTSPTGFSPEDSVTRAQMVTFLQRWAELQA